MSDKERLLKKNSGFTIRFSVFTLIYIMYVFFVNKGLPDFWWFWGLIALFLDCFVAPSYSYVYQEWENVPRERNCKNCRNLKRCQSPHRRMASDEELEHIICFAWLPKK